MKEIVQKEQGRVMFLRAAGGYALVTCSVLLLPLSGVGNESAARIFEWLVGILFWAGLLTGTVFYLRLSREMKTVLKKKEVGELRKTRRLSGLRFFRNKYARAADSLLIVGGIGTIAALLWGERIFWMQWVFMAIFITALWMHFLLNGDIFEFLFRRSGPKARKMEGERGYEKA